MKCAALESLIALYVEDDLPASDRRRIETHLQTCAVCSGLAEDLRESQSMFKSLRAGTVKSADLIDVRERVLNEVGDLEPAPGWVVTMHRLFFAGLRRKNAIAGVVLATVVSGGLWYSQSHVAGEGKKELPVAVATLEVPPSELLSDVVVPPAKLDRNRVPPVQVFEEFPVDQPEVQSINEQVPAESQVSQIPMKFVTDDPNIIIYWLPSDQGD
jgi:anti-sigma factor RsiW